MKKIGLIIGRFQPITLQHVRMINTLFTHFDRKIYIQVVVGQKTSNNKSVNPFDFNTRKELIKQVYPNDNVIVFKAQNGYLPQIIEYIQDNYGDQVTDFVCGQDRYEQYRRQVQSQKIPLNIIMIPRDNESISQTKVRQLIYQNKLEQQKNYLPSILTKKPYYDIIVQNIKEGMIKMTNRRKVKIKEGIDHIDNVKPETFIDWLIKMVKNDNIITSIKMDGNANISFTIKDGKIYANRISKHQEQLKRSITEWNNTPIHNALRNAHQYMIKVYYGNKELFDKYIGDNGSFECEVIPEQYGNILKYGYEHNTLVMIRPLYNIKQENFDKLVKELKNISTNQIKGIEYHIDDNLNINKSIKEQTWKLNSIITIDISKYLTESLLKKINTNLEELYQFLKKKDNDTSMKIHQLINTNLNNIKKEQRDLVREKRDYYRTQLKKYYNKIKELLIIELNNKIENEYHIPVEGLVIRDVVNNNQIKIVDKNYFTTLNKFYWRFNEMVSGGYKDKDGKWHNGILRKTIKEIKNLLNEKSNVKKLKKELNDIDKIHDYILSRKDFDLSYSIFNDMIKILNNAYQEITAIQNDFKKSYKNNQLNIKIKRTGYKEDITLSFDNYMFKRFNESLNTYRYTLKEMIDTLMLISTFGNELDIAIGCYIILFKL